MELGDVWSDAKLCECTWYTARSSKLKAPSQFEGVIKQMLDRSKDAVELGNSVLCLLGVWYFTPRIHGSIDQSGEFLCFLGCVCEKRKKAKKPPKKTHILKKADFPGKKADFPVHPCFPIFG